jgi:hypothetical protein
MINMKTNKEEAFDKMLNYAEQLAHNYGLFNVEEKKSTFWADFGSRELKWTDGKNKGVRVEFRSRFGNPRIDFRNNNDFAAVELSQGHRATGEKDEKGYDMIEYDGIYRPYEIQAWGEGGLAMVNIMWQELSALIHEPTNDFIEEE